MFWLATAGGAEALDLPTGSFRVGHEFDALLIDTRASASNIHVNVADDTLDDVFQKVVRHERISPRSGGRPDGGWGISHPIR